MRLFAAANAGFRTLAFTSSKCHKIVRRVDAAETYNAVCKQSIARRGVGGKEFLMKGPAVRPVDVETDIRRLGVYFRRFKPLLARVSPGLSMSAVVSKAAAFCLSPR